jgi:hypothetical protein
MVLLFLAQKYRIHTKRTRQLESPATVLTAFAILNWSFLVTSWAHRPQKEHVMTQEQVTPSTTLTLQLVVASTSHFYDHTGLSRRTCCHTARPSLLPVMAVTLA